MTDDLESHTTIDIVENRLRLARSLNPAEATKLRGYFGEVYSDEALLHQHRPEGGLIYDYPRVQFKILDRVAHLIGLAEGCAVVLRLWAEADAAQIDMEELPIQEASLVRRRETLGDSATAIRYRFLTPWLGLNQVNHQLFEEANEKERTPLLERILVGNCLSLAKAFNIRVGTRLVALALGLRPELVRLKGVSMIGFIGAFAVNFQIPERIGIGKSVSRGFGTVERIE